MEIHDFSNSGPLPQGSSVFGWWLRVSVRKRNGPGNGGAKWVDDGFLEWFVNEYCK